MPSLSGTEAVIVFSESLTLGIDLDIEEARENCEFWAIMHLPKQKQSKLYSKSKELVFTGYLDVSKKYRRLNAKEKLFNTCDVVIIEDII